MLNNAEAARRAILADVDICLFIAGLCFDAGLEDIAFELEAVASKAARAFAPVRGGRR